MRNEKAIELLDQIIDVARVEDAENKIGAKAEDRLGDSWLIYHLESLKDVLEAE